jgi:hypothetical protein
MLNPPSSRSRLGIWLEVDRVFELLLVYSASGPWAWALMGFCKKPTQPITKCGNCEREPRESSITRLCVEMSVKNIQLLSFFSITSPALVIGRNCPHLPAHLSPSPSPVRSITRFARFEEARICFTECRSSSSSSSESNVSLSSEMSAVRADESN